MLKTILIECKSIFLNYNKITRKSLFFALIYNLVHKLKMSIKKNCVYIFFGFICYSLRTIYENPCFKLSILSYKNWTFYDFLTTK